VQFDIVFELPQVDNVNKFLDDVKAGIQAAAGSDATVEVARVEAKVKIQYSFPDEVTSADVKNAIATAANVPSDKVNVTEAPVAGGGRRLADGKSWDVEIVTDDLAKAVAVKTVTANVSAIGSALKEVNANINISDVAVAKAPKATLTVVTVVKSTKADAPPKVPAISDLNDKIKEKSGVTVAVAVENEVVSGGSDPVTTTTVAVIINSAIAAWSPPVMLVATATMLAMVSGTPGTASS